MFIDIKAAFDNVLPHLLISDLKELNLPPRIIKFVDNLISLRDVQFVVQGQLSTLLLSRKGTPQGSVRSPSLFNIYLRKIRSFLHCCTNIPQFADDIVIYSSSSNVHKALDSISLSFST